MNIVFTYSTVVDPLAEAQAASAYLQAGVSQQTVLGHISIVENVDEEMKRLEEQNAANEAREKRMYTNEFTPPEDEVTEE
jgi:hypothetical protein